MTAPEAQATEDVGRALWAVGVGIPILMAVMAIGIFAVTKKHRTIGYLLVVISFVALLVGVSSLGLDFVRSLGGWW